MIAYDLKCSHGHTFEGWFEDSAAFASQNKRGLIACPACNDTAIVQLPSRFAIKTSQGFSPKEPASRAEQAPAHHLNQEVIEFVEKNFDNVGCNFAQEALKIHYGVSEPRNIRGLSTQQEEAVLKQEGIQFIKLPMPVRPDTDS
jgi:hypothetical protein